MLFSSGDVVERERYSSQDDQAQHAAGGNSENLKTLQGVGGQRLRVRVTFKRQVDIRLMQVQYSHPVSIAFQLESLLCRLEHFQRFGEALHLHERNTIISPRFRFFVAHPDIAELFDRPLRKGRSVFRQVELQVNLGFVEVAQSDVARAAGELLAGFEKTPATPWCRGLADSEGRRDCILLVLRAPLSWSSWPSRSACSYIASDSSN